MRDLSETLGITEAAYRRPVKNTGVPLLPTTSLIEYELSEEQKLIRDIQMLLRDKLAIRAESADLDLFHSGALDSAAQVHLLLHLEKHFGISLPMEELEIDSFVSVAKIAELVASNLSMQRALPAAADLTAPDISQRRDLISQVQELFLDKLSIRVESVEANLFESGVFDSMTLVQFIFHMEERFGFHLPMEDLDVDSFRSVAIIAELIGSHTQSAGHAHACGEA